MPTQTLFQPTDAPVVTNGSNPNKITMGTKIKPSINGTVTHIRFFASTTVTGNYGVGLIRNTGADPGGVGTILTSQTFTSASVTPGVWNEIALTTPQAVLAGWCLQPVVYSENGHLVATGAFFNTGLTNGYLYAPPDNDAAAFGFLVYNGAFNDGGSFLTIPNGHFNANNYWADMRFSYTVPGGNANRFMPFFGGGV